MWCNDPFIVSLKKLGYNVVRLPKADIAPLQILNRPTDDLVRLGHLSTILTGSMELPRATETPAGNISVRHTGTLSIGISLALLEGIIGALGGSQAGLDTKYSRARNAIFEVLDIIESKIEIAELDQYLADADVNPHSHYIADILESSDIYVTTHTLKSNKFSIAAKQSSDASLNLNVSEIQGIVGGSVKVSNTSGDSSKLTYEGVVPLVFGFQAIRLFYDRGRYTAFEPASSKLVMKSFEDSPQDGTKKLVMEGLFARIRT